VDKKKKKDKPVVTAPGAWISVGLIVKVMNNKIQGGKPFGCPPSGQTHSGVGSFVGT
jgi:hypothetical protein